MSKIRYVVGFVFSQDRTKVLLIRKNRPEWQAGRLNGIGGKIESNETALAAMAREFAEECGGILIRDDAWRMFASLHDQRGWSVDFFYATHPRIGDAESLTDELVEIAYIDRLGSCITNLRWLIPMALTMSYERCGRFSIEELAR